MMKRTSLAVVACALLSTAGSAADFCKPFEKFNKRSDEQQLALLESAVGARSDDWTAPQLEAAKAKLFECAEARKTKLENKKAFGSLLGAVGGALVSKGNDRTEGAAAGATAAADLFDGATDKKLLSLKAAIDAVETRTEKATVQVAETQPYQLDERQINVAKQAAYDGSDQAALNTCDGNNRCKELVAEVIATERSAYQARQAKYAARKEEERKQAETAALSEEQKRADIEQRAPAYIEAAVERNARRLAQAGFDDATLDSKYAGVTLRQYLSVLLEDKDVRVFKERTVIADVVIVVKRSGQQSTKFFFQSDYGDLRPKALQTPYDATMQLVPFLKEREFTFAAYFRALFNEQIVAGLGY